MSGHTPGPWVAIEASSLKYCSSVEYRSDIPGLSNTVCQVRQSGVLVGASALAEQNANARLIAAAPELLRELKKLVASCDASQRPGGGSIVPDSARAAIAKAEATDAP